MKYTPYSFSRLNTYKTCSRKFKYVYIDKVTPEHTDRTALLKGGAVHSILENYPNESNHKLSEKYQSVADKFIKTELGSKYFSRESIREYNFGLTPDLNPTTYNDKDALFRGSIDFICTINDTLNLCDWKTGKYRDEIWQSYDQLMFYAIYFFQKYEKINTIRISYVYVEHDNCENDMILSREFINNYKHSLLESIKTAESDELFKKNPSSLCSMCEYKIYCGNDTE